MLRWLLLADPARAGFVDATPAALALDGNTESGASFVDFDADGDWDLLAPADDATGGPHLLRNDGDGAWTDVTSALAPDLLAPIGTRGLLAADLDHDGWPDLIRTAGGAVEVYRNGGPPRFAFERAYTQDFTTAPNFEGVALLDRDRDGWLDLLVTDSGSANWVLRNPGDGSLELGAVDEAPLGLVLPEGSSDFATAADWDGDGGIDVVIRGAGAGPDAFLDAGAAWTPVVGFGLDASNDDKGVVALCDLGDDGALDLLWTRAAGLERFRWDDAALTWLSEGEQALPSGLRSVACGDLDHDGSLDLFVAQALADGVLPGPDADPADLQAVAGDLDTLAVALADVDDDGDLDAYRVHPGAPNTLLLNDTDDARWLQVRLLANVSGCAEPPVLRDDWGAQARLWSADGAEPRSGRVELSGGSGRGQTGWPVLHFGGVDPGPRRLEVDFVYGGEGPFQVELPRGHRLALVSDDPDGDGLSTSSERAAAGAADHDADGDGLFDWADADADADGRPDAEEHGADGRCGAPVDSDGDGVPDFLAPRNLPPVFFCGTAAGPAGLWPVLLLAIALPRRRAHARWERAPRTARRGISAANGTVSRSVGSDQATTGRTGPTGSGG